MWTRNKGIDAAPSIPLVQLELRFPDVDDPRVILVGLNEFRREFDLKDNPICEELTQFRNANTIV